jgi:hypothetical protein
MRALSPAIPSKMYRHFALVTVALTTGIAMFADGENREATATEIGEREQQEELRRESLERSAPPTIGQAAKPRPVRFADAGDAFDSTFGRPMMQPVGSTVSFGAIPVEVATEAAQAGYSEEYLASLGEGERNLLLAGLAKEGLLSPAERQSRSVALVAASQHRSGGSPGND